MSQEQSRGIEQIASAVTQMETVTQRSAASAEESAAAGEELAAQAHALYDIVERVRKLVGGSGGGAPPEYGTGRSLPQTGHAMAVAPRARAGRSHSGDAFPLDDSDSF